MMLSEYLWVDKYRPKRIEDITLDNDRRVKFQRYIVDEEIPHLLLYGRSGGGKTTISRILIDKIIKYEGDSIWFNGNLDVNVETLRNEIAEFLLTPARKSKIKIIVIDEADRLSIKTREALKGLMEEYQTDSRFIFTCNRIHLFEEAILSRFTMYKFDSLPKENIIEFSKKVLINEKIEFNEKQIEKIVDIFYPDMRRIINFLQKNTINNEFIFNNTDLNNNKLEIKKEFDQILKILKDGKGDLNKYLDNVISLVQKENINFYDLYEDIFEDKEVPIWAKTTVAEYGDSHNNSFVPSIHFLAMVNKIIYIGIELFKKKKEDNILMRVEQRLSEIEKILKK